MAVVVDEEGARQAFSQGALMKRMQLGLIARSQDDDGAMPIEEIAFAYASGGLAECVERAMDGLRSGLAGREITPNDGVETKIFRLPARHILLMAPAKGIEPLTILV